MVVVVFAPGLLRARVYVGMAWGLGGACMLAWLGGARVCSRGVAWPGLVGGAYDCIDAGLARPGLAYSGALGAHLG